MEIIRGVIPCAKKVVIYGPEGIGKSTFASKFPDPVFIDTEGSTNSMDVARLPKASSWQMLLDQVDYVRTHPTMCKTLVIDTIDWAESMCIRHICDKHRKSGIEDFGYGNGYVYVKEELGKFLNQLTEVVEADVNVVLTAHAQIRKFEQPDELGAYDRWELKLGKKTASQTSPLIKEWADMLLFANYKTFSIAVDDKGKKRKAQGGERVMYTTHNACWDAKNRYGLPDEVPFSYDSIRTIIEGNAVPVKETQPKSVPAQQPVQAQPTVQPQPTTVQEATKTEPAVTVGEQMNLPLNEPQKTPEPTARSSTIDPGIPKALRDLMESNQVDEWDIQNVVAARGYYPSDVKVKDYDMDFIQNNEVPQLTTELPVPHYLGEIPIIEYLNNKLAIGDFELQIPLIDAYNALMSDRITDKEQFIDAILAIYGTLLSDEDESGTEEEDQNIKKAKERLKKYKVLEMPDTAKAEYLTRTFDESGVEILKKAIEQDIHKFSHIPCMSDESFGGNVSGVAMEFKLLGMENITKIKTRYYRKGLRKRIRIFCNYLELHGKSVDPAGITMTFTRALPKNLLEISQIVANLWGKVSRKTLLSQVPFVDDVDEELKALDEETEENLKRQQEVFGMQENTPPQDGNPDQKEPDKSEKDDAE